jgi:hypothetical protein
LRILNARNNCGISDDGISKLTNLTKLTKLDIWGNPKITKKIDK